MFLRLILVVAIYHRFTLLLLLLRYRDPIRSRPILRRIIIAILLPLSLLFLFLAVGLTVEQELLCVYLLSVRPVLPDHG